MEAALKGQVNRSAAVIYDEFFVPALFAEWAPRVSEAARLTAGKRILDVACGTGVLACHAARITGPNGTVIGVDCNEGMLEVARQIPDDIEWRLAAAEALPFDDGEFDAVVSQFGLMFFEDPVKAMSEMWRVLRLGGRMAVAVWGRLEDTPGYAAMTDLLQDLFGARAANALRAPYCLGDTDELLTLSRAAGMAQTSIETVQGTAVFPSIAAWVRTDVKGWTLTDMIDETQYRQLQQAAENRLKTFIQPDGTVRFSHPAHILIASKR